MRSPGASEAHTSWSASNAWKRCTRTTHRFNGLVSVRNAAPLDEIGRFLGGYEIAQERLVPRPVAIVDVGEKKTLDLGIRVPTRDMGGSLGHSIRRASGG